MMIRSAFCGLYSYYKVMHDSCIFSFESWCQKYSNLDQKLFEKKMIERL